MLQTNGRSLAGVCLLLAVAALLINLGARPLSHEEPRRALVALEMDLRGEHAVPTTHGTPYLAKPPVFNWVLLGSMKLFRSADEWVLRFPTVVSYLVTALLVYGLARRYLGQASAVTAAALFLTFGNLLFKASVSAEIDLFYAMIVALQAASILHFEQAERPLPLFVVSYLLAGVGFLTKGFPSLAVQGLTLVPWLVRAGKLRALLSWQHVAGVGVLVLCVGGYFAWYAQSADPLPFVAKLFLESSERTAAGSEREAAAVALHGVGFPVQLLWLLLPWSLLVPLVLRNDFRAGIPQNPLLRFSALFLVANLVPHWLSPGTRDRYMYMLLPFAAVLLAAALERGARQRWWYARLLERVLGACVVASAGAALALPFTPLRTFAGPPWAWVVLCAALLALALGFVRNPAARPVIVLLAVLCLRIGYDLVVPNVRRASSEATFHRNVVDVLNGRYADEKILLAAAIDETETGLPIVGKRIVIPEAGYFPFAVSFYFTAERREVLELTQTLVQGRLHLARWEFPVERSHEIVEVFRSPVEGGHDLKLFRVLD